MSEDLKRAARFVLGHQIGSDADLSADIICAFNNQRVRTAKLEAALSRFSCTYEPVKETSLSGRRLRRCTRCGRKTTSTAEYRMCEMGATEV